jgi:hypothetical protein
MIFSSGRRFYGRPMGFPIKSGGDEFHLVPIQV